MARNSSCRASCASFDGLHRHPKTRHLLRRPPPFPSLLRGASSQPSRSSEGKSPMTDTVTLEALATDVRAKLDAISTDVTNRTSDEQLKRLINEAFEALKDDAEFVRKLRFGAGEV